MCFFPNSGEDQEEKKGLHRNSGLYSAEISRMYLCWVAVFRLIIQCLNLDGGTPNLNGGMLNLDGGTLTLNGGHVSHTI